MNFNLFKQAYITNKILIKNQIKIKNKELKVLNTTKKSTGTVTVKNPEKLEYPVTRTNYPGTWVPTKSIDYPGNRYSVQDTLNGT